jgi:hypothetical protein
MRLSRTRTVRTLSLLVTTLAVVAVASPMRADAAGTSSVPSGPGGQSRHHLGLPDSFQWRSTGPLISPKPDATHPVVSVKDPTIVRYRNRWLVYATTANTSGNWSLVYTSFRDFQHAPAAPQVFLDTNANIGTGYRAAPQVFYFAPKRTWYLIYQTGLPSFSTTTDPTRPQTWSAPRNLQDSMPPIIAQNIGNGFWLDFWVICDNVHCFLFSSDDNGHLYRTQTTVAAFPGGWGETVIAKQDARFSLFEASNVYKIKGTNQYLLLVEAIGASGRRYFRSWTSDRIDGEWTALADTEAAPFAGAANVSFRPGAAAWTQDISHGEMLRDGNDQHLVIDPRHLRYLYQGEDPAASGDYSQLPWRLALLTQTNSHR